MRTPSWTLLCWSALLAACNSGDTIDLEGPCQTGGACKAGASCNPVDNQCYASSLYPTTTIAAAPAAVSADAAARFELGGEGAASFECRVDGAAFAACATPFTVTVAEGAHTFAARARSARGLVDLTPATHAWSVDLTPPTTTIVSGPPATTALATATFSFASNETGSSFECSLDGAAFAPCPASFDGLADGAHTLRARAVDRAGNVDPAPPGHGWIVDRAGPTPAITSGPAEGATSGPAVTFAFSLEAGASYRCALDGGAASDCSAGLAGYGPLAGGPHTFAVTGTDAAGNVGPQVTRGWSVDATGPAVTFTDAPAPGSTTGPRVSIGFVASVAGATFACALDGAAFAPCTSPAILDDLAGGAHGFVVHAIDGAGVTGGDSALGFSVDRTPPAVTLVAPAAGSTQPSTLTVVWTCDDPAASFSCALDGGAATACTSPQPYAGLAGGAHGFVLTARDPAGNSVTLPALSFVVNDAPVVAAIPDQTVDEDGSVTIPLDIADAQGAALIVTATSDDPALLPGLTVAGAALTVTPAADASGRATVTISVSDGALAAATSFAVTVRPVDDPPRLDPIPDRFTDEGQPTTVALAVSDVDTAPSALSVTASSSDQALVPDAALVVSATALTVTPAAQQSGAATITVRASDGHGATARSFVLTVGAVNDRPTIAAIADQTVAEDEATGAIAVTVGDADTPAGELLLDASTDAPALLPEDGIVLGGSDAARTVTLTPAPDASGTATVTLMLSDGAATTQRSFRLTVVPVNDPPLVSAIGPQSTLESTPTAAIGFTIDDLESGPGALVITASSGNPAVLEHGGITVGGSGGSRTVTCAPVPGQSGTAAVTLAVSDGAATTTVSFVLSVGVVNDPPSIADVTAQATDEDQPLTVAVTVADPDTAAGDLVVTASSSNRALVPDGNLVAGGAGGARSLTITPAHDASGRTTITVSVTDGTSTASDSFVLDVRAVNDAPTISAIGPQTVAEDGVSGAIPFVVADPESAASALAVSAASSNPGLLAPDGIAISGGGAARAVTLTPAANQSGSATVTLTVSDGAALATTSFVVTVTAVNDPPAISAVAAQTTAEDTAVVVAFIVGDRETASDALTLAASASPPSLLASATFAGTGADRTVTLTPSANGSGSGQITLTVSDGAAQASSSFTLTVTAVNDPPTIGDVANQTIDEDGATAALPVAISDAETAAAGLTLTASSSNQGLVPDGNIALGGSGAARTVKVVPLAGKSGTVTITLVVSDGAATSADSFTVTVTGINDPPTISDLGATGIVEDGVAGPLTFTVGDAETAAGSLTVAGTSSDPLVPSGNIVFGGSGATRTVTVTPAANASGSTTITVSVSDGVNSASDSFLLTVTAVNDPPAISAIADQVLREDQPTRALAFSVSDVETAAGSLTVTGGSSNPTLVPVASIVLDGSGGDRTVTVTPAADQSGTATITLTVSDGTSNTLESFTVTFDPRNDAPVVSAIADQITDPGQQVGPLTFTVTDVDSPVSSFVFAATSSDHGIVDPALIVFGVSPAGQRTIIVRPSQTLGSALVTVRVTDDGGAVGTSAFTVTVAPPELTTVTTAVTPAGAGTARNDACSSSSCPVVVGSAVTLRATPTQTVTVRFTGWTGASCPVAGSGNAVVTFTAPASDVTCTAVFEAPCWVSCTGACEGQTCWVNDRLVVDGENAYFTRVPRDRSGKYFPVAVRIMKAPLTGGRGVVLAELDRQVSALAQRGTRLYLLGATGAVSLAKTGGVTTGIFTGGGTGDDLVVDATHVWFVDPGDAVFRHQIAAGGVLESRIDHVADDGPAALAADTENVYFLDGDELRTGVKAGQGGRDLATITVPAGSGKVWSRMARAGNFVMWAVADAAVGWYNLANDNLTETPIVTDTAGMSFAADTSGAYFTDADATRAADGLNHQAGPQVDVTFLPFAVPVYVADLAVDGSFIYVLTGNEVVRMGKP